MSASATSFRVQDAHVVAERIRDALMDVCERIAIVGSVRRRRPRVHDIDLLVVPKLELTRADDLFGAPKFRSLLDERLGALEQEKRLTAASVRPLCQGWKVRRWIATRSKVPVDLFAVSEETWWTGMVIRTGSKEHNVFLCGRARERGLVLHAGGEGLEGPNGDRMQLESEAEVFDRLDERYVEPENRERSARKEQ